MIIWVNWCSLNIIVTPFIFSLQIFWRHWIVWSCELCRICPSQFLFILVLLAQFGIQFVCFSHLVSLDVLILHLLSDCSISELELHIIFINLISHSYSLRVVKHVLFFFKILFSLVFFNLHQKSKFLFLLMSFLSSFITVVFTPEESAPWSFWLNNIGSMVVCLSH